MPEAVLEKRVDKLEQAMMELVYQARRTEMSIEKPCTKRCKLLKKR